MTQPFFANDDFRKKVLSAIPPGRIGRVEDVTAAVLFLASSAANLVACNN